MRISTACAACAARWATVFLTLVLLIGASVGCSGSSSQESGNETQSQPDRERITNSPPPTPTSQPPSATEPPTVAALPVFTTQSSTAMPAGSVSANPSSPTTTPTAEAEQPTGADEAANLLLAAFEDVLGNIYESAVPSVVYIRVPSAASATLQGIQGVPDDLLWNSGSGFVWDAEGHIVTNHHVVEDVLEGRNHVTVIFADSTQAKGRVVGSDPHSDLAVIKLEAGDWNLKPAKLGDSSNVKVGQLTVAIGAPFGQEFTMTSGIVSGVGRNISGQTQFTIPEAIQTDSAINPGNSGGPLIDRYGKVIGINTSILSRSGSFSGVGMAVPVNIAKRVVPPLISDGEFNYPWLGVNIATVTDLYLAELELPDATRGVLVIATVPNSPAERAGLKGSDYTVEIDGTAYPAGGDIILAIGSNDVTNSSELIAHLTYNSNPGDTVTLAVLRDGHREEIEVTLGRRPAGT